MNDGITWVTRTELPNVPGNDNTSMHSHDVVVNQTKNGSFTWNNVLVPGPDDPGTFTKFKQNVIVGNLGDPTLGYKDGKPAVTRMPDQGAAFYSRGGTKPILTLTKRAISKILGL